MLITDEQTKRDILLRIIREKAKFRNEKLQINYVNSEYYTAFGVPADSQEQSALIYRLADEHIIKLNLPLPNPVNYRVGDPTPSLDVQSLHLTDRDLIMCAEIV